MHPQHLESHLVLGILLCQTSRWGEAAKYLEQVVNASPNRDEAIYWLALAKKNAGDNLEAVLLCERALKINPFNPIVLNESGLCRMALNQPDLAAGCFRKAIEIEPQKSVYHFNHGVAMVRLDRIHSACDSFREAVRLEPNRVQAYLELVRLLEILDSRDEALWILKEAVERNPTEVQLLTALASATAYSGDRVDAENQFQRAMAAFPSSANAYGLWLQQEGRFEESIGCFVESLKHDPIQGVGYYGLAEAKRFDVEGIPWLDRAVQLAESNDLDLKGKTYLLYAIAKAYDRTKDIERCISYFHQANASAYLLYNDGRPFNRPEIEALTSKTIEKYPSGSLEESLKGASPSLTPIFIVGMIRSGTTLLDQIISSHPDVVSAGEPVFWMREADRIRRLKSLELMQSDLEDIGGRYLETLKKVGGDSPRITDKMPLNYAHLGLIHMVFPNAKIIHLRRKPLDTCFSIYTTFLGQGPTFAYNQSNIIFSYMQYLRLMQHWREAFPREQFLEIRYESLIENREEVTRQVIEFCGLDWDDSCLYHERNESSIRTPSKWQARQPIYKSSVNRWKPYEKWLGELLSLNDLNY